MQDIIVTKYSDCKHLNTLALIYAHFMHANRINPRDSLAANLRVLMAIRGYDQPTLAKLAGVAQKTVSNIVNRRTAPNLDKIDAIAAVFGLTSWHLIMPDLPQELIAGGEIEKLFRKFIAADPKGREYIQHVADRESKYRQANDD